MAERRVQCLGGPLHGYYLMLGGNPSMYLTDADGVRCDPPESHELHGGYRMQTLPSGEQRFVCQPARPPMPFSLPEWMRP